MKHNLTGVHTHWHSKTHRTLALSTSNHNTRNPVRCSGREGGDRSRGCREQSKAVFGSAESVWRGLETGEPREGRREPWGRLPMPAKTLGSHRKFLEGRMRKGEIKNWWPCGRV